MFDVESMVYRIDFLDKFNLVNYQKETFCLII